MPTYCDKCGHTVSADDSFCQHCGKVLAAISKEKTKKHGHILPQKAQLRPNIFVGVVIVAVLVVVGVLSYGTYHFYQSYVKTEQAVQQTAGLLQGEEAKLNEMASSANQGSASTTAEDTSSTGDGVSPTGSSDEISSAVNDNLANYAPSVVKIICNSDAAGDELQQGSGVLYHSSTSSIGAYFVETNLHVVQTSDGSPTRCVIAVYPDYTDSSYYLTYTANGYSQYQSDVDFAYLVPKVDASLADAGTEDQLAQYARELTSTTYCSDSSIGDHLTILGYPAVGGSSLTATDGIISGYEYDSGVRYIKTSAEIDHGNSGGVAIEDNGCVLGIPTFVDEGELENLGRVLDLNALFNNGD